MPRTFFRVPIDMRDEIIRQYTTRLPDGTWKGGKSIAREFGISPQTVANVIQSAGIQMRTVKEAHAHGKRSGPIKHIEQLGQPPLCACGCGSPTHWVRSKYQWATFARGHYRKDAPYKSREWLLEQYIEKQRGIPSIARECKVNVTTIIKFMKQFGIERRDARAAHIGTQAGSRNPAWKGGTTPLRQQLYKTQEWKALLKDIYARDNYTCQRCKRNTHGGRGRRSSVAHHIKSFAEHPALRMEPANLITLCRKCHEWVHSKANTAREYLG